MYKTAMHIYAFAFLLLCAFRPGFAADNETCFMCHSDEELTTERNGSTIQLYVDENSFSRSIHQGLDCIACHPDADVEDFPHPEDLAPVNCGNCHDDAQADFKASIHGMALERHALYAPSCMDCHGKHDILAHTAIEAPTYKMNIPYLCGKCHREGAPVARAYNISEHNIIENYSQSIHGEGLFKKGLTVTATCTDCHQSHLILPRNYSNSSISIKNVAGTCMQCHTRIEQVHTQIIKGALWESKPGAIPACTDCHLPHKARKESVILNLSDKACLKCHEKENITKNNHGEKLSVFVNKEDLAQSIHTNIPCVKCHSDINPSLTRPCEPAGKVDCANCHAKTSEEYYASKHGEAYLNKNTQVPYCTTCHGTHKVKAHLDDTSPTFRSSVPSLCGECHKEDGKASEFEGHAYSDYSKSVHGRGLTEKGLLPSAICTDCHNSHMILSHNDPLSSINKKNIPSTCATCHRGIFKQFAESVHLPNGKPNADKLPTCSDCHTSHTISPVKKDKFMNEVTHQCGVCHQDLAATYFDTMHGKAYTLGYLKAAKCSDCHGAHDIREINDANSSVGFKNVVSTCQKCHEDANIRFTGYLTHATHHDPVRYPILYYTYWAMTSLLLGVFTFFGIHTLLWLPRSIRHMRKRKKGEKPKETKYSIQRFSLSQRITHIFVIASFLLLALTGMMLKFSSMPWAGFLASLFGGVHGAGLLHRIAAIITFGYFFYHIYSLLRMKQKRKMSFKELLFGKNSLMFGLQDIKEFWATLKWFFHSGPRPEYGRWTYWEKFDYFAVFWGVAIIGASGLIQWFPEYFTFFLPGWLINVAAIIHSDEALLAVGFIFTIHFFNTHLRPEAFPMDKVIFTGLVPLEEYKADRPREYQELVESGQLRKRVFRTQINAVKERLVYSFGFAALLIGIILIGLIIYSVLFGYK
jgi:predicted CXXCH cytochrome family protein